VDRRIEQLVQDAEGLGWSAPGGNFGFQFGPLLEMQRSSIPPKALTPKKKTDESKPKRRTTESEDE
jgi:hypothetical protein